MTSQEQLSIIINEHEACLAAVVFVSVWAFVLTIGIVIALIVKHHIHYYIGQSIRYFLDRISPAYHSFSNYLRTLRTNNPYTNLSIAPTNESLIASYHSPLPQRSDTGRQEPEVLINPEDSTVIMPTTEPVRASYSSPF